MKLKYKKMMHQQRSFKTVKETKERENEERKAEEDQTEKERLQRRYDEKKRLEIMKIELRETFKQKNVKGICNTA